MDLQPEDWDVIVSDVRHSKCVLFLGRELPAGSGPDLSVSLSHALAQLLQEKGMQAPCADDLHQVAQLLEQKISQERVRTHACKHIHDHPAEPYPIHRTLAGLNFPIVLTSRWDDLMARAFHDAGKSPTTWFYNWSLHGPKPKPPRREHSDPASPLLVHLCGHQQNPYSIVFSERDLLELIVSLARDKPELPGVVRNALRGKTFLFLGLGVRHWYARILLHLIRHTDHNLSEAFAMDSWQPGMDVGSPDMSRMVLFYREGYRLTVHDTDVEEFANELKRRCQADSDPRPAGPRAFISYAWEDRDAAQRLNDRLKDQGIDPWFDRERPEVWSAGSPFARRIHEEIERRSTCVLVVNSRHLLAKNSGVVFEEIRLALDRAKRSNQMHGSFVIPVRVDDSELYFPLAEERVQPWTPGDEGSYAELATRIRQQYARSLRE